MFGSRGSLRIVVRLGIEHAVVRRLVLLGAVDRSNARYARASSAALPSYPSPVAELRHYGRL
jgi:hypothetical protein